MRTFIKFFFLFSTVFADTAVRYVHLALTGNPTEMSVGWYTQDSTPTSECNFGLTSKLGKIVVGTSNSWKDGYGYNHFAKLINLIPNTTYYYSCGSQNDWSEIFHFISATDKKVPFKIGVYGDLGIEYSNHTMFHVSNRVLKGEIDWIYHVGDISYADDHVFSFQETWNTWFRRMEPVTSRVPYMVIPGNHEYTSFDPLLIWDTINFVVYNHRFMMPNANKQSKSMYYSFDYSNVHFVSYSTESSFPDSPFPDGELYGDQMEWLKNDLATANLPENRKMRPWIIVVGHRPIYSSDWKYSYEGVPIDSIEFLPSNSATLQRVFEDIFYEYKVDLILNGHVHAMERTYPVYKNNRTSGYIEPTSYFNLIIGCAGNIEELDAPNSDDWTQPAPQWSAYRWGKGYGYGILDIESDTELSWRFYRSSDNGLEDSVHVVKHH